MANPKKRAATAASQKKSRAATKKRVQSVASKRRSSRHATQSAARSRKKIAKKLGRAPLGKGQHFRKKAGLKKRSVRGPKKHKKN
jgi:hypothetical protein|tara:strand:+ start:219 stop:473 length:255 start_codon:yes stop_codon:yes gene_type:complete